MIAVYDLPATASLEHIRPMDPRRDLTAVADLIELAFAAQMDPDGREYLRQMRRLADQVSSWSWPHYYVYHGPAIQGGLVWEENGRVIGNLSLIPHLDGLKRVYLIANVSVHPEYRGQGIGKALTRAALERIRREGVTIARLQVRDDNQVAYGLYRELGFRDAARRTTWISSNLSSQPDLPDGMTVSDGTTADWHASEAWLRTAYPPAVSWNLPMRIDRLKPGLIPAIGRLFNAERIRQWALRINGILEGTATWQASNTFADNVWLAAAPQVEHETIAALLPYIKRLAYPTRPLSVNYPAGQAEGAFQWAGFTVLHTLVWMEQELE